MFTIQILLNEEKAQKELGKNKLDNMYGKLEKMYIEETDMLLVKRDSSGIFFSGDTELQRIIGVCLAIAKGFPWFRTYVSKWHLYYDTKSDYDDLIADLL